MSKTFKLKNFPESSQEALCHPFLYLTVLEYYQNVSMIFSKMLTNEYIFLWMKWQLLSHLYYNYCYIILLLLKRNMNHGKSTIGLFNDFHLHIQIILYENISWCTTHDHMVTFCEIYFKLLPASNKYTLPLETFLGSIKN